jgi:cytidylate kinase
VQTQRAFSIAVSREAGTEGGLIATEVGELLGWHVYDQELVERIAQDMGLRATLLESADEHHQGWLMESMAAFLAPVQGDAGWLVPESSYAHQLVKTVLALGAHGECVIVGRGAAFILPPQTTLRVRLVGPVAGRIAAVSRKLGISEHEAPSRIRAIDQERTQFVRNHFHKDPTDPHNYDLILNAVRLTVRHSAELIVETLNHLRAAT